MDKCKEILSNLASALPHYFPSPPIILMLLSLTVAFIFLFIQVYKTRRYIKNILEKTSPFPLRIKKIARELGIENKLVATRSGSFTSFCFGLFSPKICLNLKFASSLTKEELRAVFLHEIHHLKNKDPLKILLAQTLQPLLFFLPILKDFQNHYLLSKEVAADRTVLKQAGVFALRNALIKSINLPDANFALARFFVEYSLEQRVKVLTTASKSISFKVSFSRLFISVAVLLFYLLFTQLPIYAVDSKDEHSYYYCASGQRLFSPANYSPVD